MTIRADYVRVSERQVGTGTLHTVHAFWDAVRDDQGAVKRAASAAVRKAVGRGGSVTFESWEVDSFKHPSMNASVQVRVLSDADVKRIRELKSRRYTACEGPGTDGKGCASAPGEVVRVDDAGTEQALCYGCRTALPKGSYQVRHWIKADGRIQIN